MTSPRPDKSNANAIVIAGAGPAGLAAAIAAAKAAPGASVTILEANHQCGAKLLATGGGHCNVSNRRPAEEWPALFNPTGGGKSGKKGRFIVPALRRLPLPDLLAWFKELGVPCHSPDGFHLFPASNSARAVRDALTAEAERLGVAVKLRRRVDAIAIDENGAVRSMRCADEDYPCDAAVIAIGGRSMPDTGSRGDAATLLVAAGHRVTPFSPGLVGLRSDSLSPDLAGVVLPRAETFLRIRGKGETAGSGPEGRELLLTHGGLSGPAVLDLSGLAAERLEHAPGEPLLLRVRWVAGMDAAAWFSELDDWRHHQGSQPLAVLLRRHLPRRLAVWLCARAGVGAEVTAAQLPASGRENLSAALGNFPARITGTEGWDKAMITRGGVALSEVDPENLASLKVAGLYFAGEALDVDGPCGGYNLHWAFASGLLAGSAAAK